MVTVLPAGTGSSAFHGLHGPHDPSAAVSFYPNVYPPHVPRVAGNSNSKAIHLRSSSMPEAVYIAKQQQAQALINLGAIIGGAGVPNNPQPIPSSPSYPESYSMSRTVPSNQNCPLLGVPLKKQEVKNGNRICYY